MEVKFTVTALDISLLPTDTSGRGITRDRIQTSSMVLKILKQGQFPNFERKSFFGNTFFCDLALF